MRYVLRRLLRALVLLAATSILCFVLTELAPGSYFDELRLNPQISPQTVAALRAQYGLDRPLPERYARWLLSAACGEFGYSFSYNLPVRTLLLVRARNTLLLAGVATLLAWALAIPLGVWAAVRRGGWPDRAMTAMTSFVLSVPEIAIALAALGVAAHSGILPVGGKTSVGFDDLSWFGKAVDLARHLVIPASVLALGIVAVVLRHVRSSVGEVLDTSYIRAARGLGIRTPRLLFRHVLPAAAHTAISLFGLSIAALLSGSLAVEAITGWPGLGPLLLEATIARDPYVIIGAVMLSATLVILGTLLTDLLLLVADPRITLGGADA